MRHGRRRHELKRLMGLLRFTLHATDGVIGRVRDLYFDDHRWTVRYVVADTRRWLPDRTVLISPIWVRAIDWRGSRLDLDLTRDRVRKSRGTSGGHARGRPEPPECSLRGRPHDPGL